MRTFIKNCYSIYSTLYLLWLVSAAIIISEEGFNFVKDAPWFLLFTSLLSRQLHMKCVLFGLLCSIASIFISSSRHTQS